ncbi:hypothetical protein Tco_0186126 [Tanacetum coccineum]
MLPKTTIKEINKLLKGFLLCLREKVKKHVFDKIGNGKSVSAWYDKWCVEGPLGDFITTRDLYDARLSNKSNVVSLIEDGNWCWPNEWNTKFPRLNQIPLPNLQDNKQYEAVWITRDGKMSAFLDILLFYGLMCKFSDSHGHLFFTCPFSNSVWVDMQSLLNKKLACDWKTIVDEVLRMYANNNIWNVL